MILSAIGNPLWIEHPYRLTEHFLVIVGNVAYTPHGCAINQALGVTDISVTGDDERRARRAEEKLIRRINIWSAFQLRGEVLLSISSAGSRGGPLFSSYKERDPTRRQDQRSPTVTRGCRSADPANGIKALPKGA
jgi:hypothetical protein